jgi:hypothetical protein
MADNYDLGGVVEEIRKYINSPKGQRELTEAMGRAEETCRQMEEASRMNWKDLFEPMTI